MTDLQQTLLITNFHNIIQELEDYSSHTFTTLSQTLHRIFQQVSRRWMSIDFLLQLIQQTMVQFFINIHSHSFQQIMIQFFIYFNNILQHFFITSSTNIQRTLTKHSSQHSSQQIEWYIIHHKHSTNIFEKRPSKHSFQQTMIHFFINTSAQTFTIGELVIDHSLHTSSHLHHD